MVKEQRSEGERKEVRDGTAKGEGGKKKLDRRLRLRTVFIIK